MLINRHMVHETTATSQYLATNIQDLRAIRQLSQSSLAKLALVPRSTVTYLESGAANPSLHSLLSVAGALQVSIEELLQKPRSINNCQLVKGSDIPVQVRSDGLAKIFKLLPDKIPSMELDRMELAPGARVKGIPHTKNTKEYFTCISGQVEVIVNETKYCLSEGDVLAFQGDQRHSYVNSGKRQADCMSVVVLAPLGV